MRGVHRAVHTFFDVGFVAHGTAFLGSDVEVHHLEKAQQLKFANVKVVASGPLFAALGAREAGLRSQAYSDGAYAQYAF
jgi:hypothetical protein